MDELKPCPFCNGVAGIDAPNGSRKDRLVFCKSCFASICEDSTPDAIAAWNRRHPSGAAAGGAGAGVLEKVERVAQGAATSLETISLIAGRASYGNPPIPTYMESFADVRAYAANRARATRDELAELRALLSTPQPVAEQARDAARKDGAA